MNGHLHKSTFHLVHNQGFHQLFEFVFINRETHHTIKKNSDLSTCGHFITHTSLLLKEYQCHFCINFRASKFCPWGSSDRWCVVKSPSPIGSVSPS